MLTTGTPKTKRPKGKMNRLFAEYDGSMVVRWIPAHLRSDEQLRRFCRDNEGWQIEQTAEEELVTMPPASGDTGNWELELETDLNFWARSVGGGKTFGPSAGFRLSDGVLLAPDISWISQTRLDAMPSGSLHGFPPVCPDFVLEFRSRSDRLPTLQKKMAGYITNDACLGWLIDLTERQVFIYRPGQPVENLKAPATLSGEAVLPGFTLDLARVW